MPDTNQPERKPHANDGYEQMIEEGMRGKSDATRQVVKEIIDEWRSVSHEPPKRVGPPPGFTKCPTCGEYNGETRWENLTWHGPCHDHEPGEMVRVRCVCNGVLCQRCKKHSQCVGFLIV